MSYNTYRFTFYCCHLCNTQNLSDLFKRFFDFKKSELACESGMWNVVHSKCVPQPDSSGL